MIIEGDTPCAIPWNFSSPKPNIVAVRLERPCALGICPQNLPLTWVLIDLDLPDYHEIRLIRHCKRKYSEIAVLVGHRLQCGGR